MTDYETIARQRLYLVHDSDRLERRRKPERNRLFEGALFMAALWGAVFGIVAAIYGIAVALFGVG